MENKMGNNIKKIFKYHWEEFCNKYDSLIRPVVKAIENFLANLGGEE